MKIGTGHPDPRRLAGFLRQWLMALIGPVVVSLALVTLGIRLVTVHRMPEVSLYVAVAGALSFPVQLAIYHAKIMRGILRRPALWGIMTGFASVAAGVALHVLARERFALFASGVARIAHWLEDVASVENTSTGFINASLAGVLLGLIVGGLQAIALGARWRPRLQWCLVSALSGMAATNWVHLCTETIWFVRILNDAAEVLSNTGARWHGILVLHAWVASIAAAYALPTGLAMRRFLRRRAATESAALAARFD